MVLHLPSVLMDVILIAFLITHKAILTWWKMTTVTKKMQTWALVSFRYWGGINPVTFITATTFLAVWWVCMHHLHLFNRRWDLSLLLFMGKYKNQLISDWNAVDWGPLLSQNTSFRFTLLLMKESGQRNYPFYFLAGYFCAFCLEW